MKSAWLLPILLVFALCACVPATVISVTQASPVPILPTTTPAFPSPTPVASAVFPTIWTIPTAAATTKPTFKATRTATSTPQSPTATAMDTPTSTPGPSLAPTAVAVLTGTFEITRALSALYSSYGLTFTAAGLAQFPANGPLLTSTVKVLIAAPFTEDNIEKYALVIAEEGAWGDCQSCGLPVDAATFARQGNTWVAVWRGGDDGVDRPVTGLTPPGELVKISPNRHGYLFRNPLASQGYSIISLDLYGEANGMFASLASVPYYSETMQTAGASWASWKSDSTYQFVPGENPDYFDLHVATSGTVPDEGQIARFSIERVYTYRHEDTIFGGSYERQYNSDPPPTSTSLPDSSFSLRRALETLYGQYPGAVVSNTNVVYIPEVESNFSITWEINIVLAVPYDEAGLHKLVVLTEWSKGPRDGGEDACHACGADLGGGIFVKSGSAWVAETTDISNTLGTIGTWGHIPDGHLVQIGPNKHGFIFFPYTGGIGGSDQLMYLYAEVAGQLKQIAVFDGFNESFPAYPEDHAWLAGHKSIYQFRPGPNPEYYDLYIDTTGACTGYEYYQATCGLRVFSFNGSEYVRSWGLLTPTPPNP